LPASCASPAPMVPPLSCSHIASIRAAGTSSERLCFAVSTILERATCDQLADHQFLVNLIEAIGLAGDLRRERIYGPAAIHMRRMGSRAGLWQDPGQISSALLALGKALGQRPATSLSHFEYLEVGVYTCWTCVVISSYLKRLIGSAGHFAGHAVDVKSVNIHQGTFALMTRLNVSFEGRAVRKHTELWSMTPLGPPRAPKGHPRAIRRGVRPPIAMRPFLRPVRSILVVLASPLIAALLSTQAKPKGQGAVSRDSTCASSMVIIRTAASRATTRSSRRTAASPCSTTSRTRPPCSTRAARMQAACPCSGRMHVRTCAARVSSSSRGKARLSGLSSASVLDCHGLPLIATDCH